MHGQPADIDPRIADESDKALVASFRAGVDSAFRPDFGTDGEEIKLRTNFFPVRIPLGLKLYAYDVAIIPDVYHAERHVKNRIYHLAERTTAWAQAGMSLPGRVAHDGHARLVAVYPLPQPLTIEVPYYDEDERGSPQQGSTTYTLTITFVQEIDTGSLARCLAFSIRNRARPD